jgi:hypothetical protein
MCIMFCLTGIASPQGLLGDARFFKQEYVRAITAGNDKHATERARAAGAGRAADLRVRIAPYFLRREKQQVLGPAAGWVPQRHSERLFSLRSCPLWCGPLHIFCLAL